MIAIKDINWFHAVLLLGTPLIGIYGALTTPLLFKTAVWSVIYYFITGFGITGGYHRYWAHRSYEATRAWQYFLLAASTGAVEGSIRWWCRDHRAHHRFTDTPKDPYSAQYGLWWSHMGWMLMKQNKDQIGRVDISDLNRDPAIMFQHKNYLPLAIFFGFILPTLVAGLGWGDWSGGYFYAGVLRLVFVHHATFCVNSLAHYLGEHTFDDRRTPRDHFFTALMTLGEGYHNFHHEFPSDYRNATIWYQYDPTKWAIWVGSIVGLTYNLKMFPENEIIKGKMQLQQKKIDEIKAKLSWGVPLDELPTLNYEQVQSKVQKEGKQLMVISGVVYDVTKFMDDHPGGRGFLKAGVGRDMTESFNGSIYNHSNAARNLMSSMRYAILDGLVPESERAKEE